MTKFDLIWFDFVVLVSVFVNKIIHVLFVALGSSVAESLACWTQAQKGLGSNRSRDAVE